MLSGSGPKHSISGNYVGIGLLGILMVTLGFESGIIIR